MHEEHMGRDAYRRSKYGHSYHDRAHRTSCPECNLSGQNCDYPNGEEFSATSGEQAYYKTVRTTVQLLVFYILLLAARFWSYAWFCFLEPGGIQALSPTSYTLIYVFANYWSLLLLGQPVDA